MTEGRWPVGVTVIEEMIDAGLIQSGVRTEHIHVELMFADAEQHLRTADVIKDSDPKAAYSLMYDAVRKALVAALAKQGLRVRGGEAGHVSVSEAIMAQLGENAGRLVEPFDRMRRKRNKVEYDFDVEIFPEDVSSDLPKARIIVERVRLWSQRLGTF